MSILDLVQQHLGPQEMEQIAQQLGTDPASARQAVDAALPALVGGMASTAQHPDGESQIRTLAGSHGNALGDLGSIIGGGGAGGGILGSILGRHEPDVQQGVQQASGLDSAKARKLLMILAPIVLSALARRSMGGAATSPTTPGTQPSGGGLGDVLGGGGLGGVLGGVLGGLGGAGGTGGGLGDILRQDATQAQARTQGSPIGGVLGKILGGLGG